MGMLKAEQRPSTASDNVESNGDDLELIINDIGGSFGKFQILMYALYSIPIAVSGVVAMQYVFAAFNLDYRWSVYMIIVYARNDVDKIIVVDHLCRCRIPKCDDINSPNYNADWLGNVVPMHTKLSKCYRYEKWPSSNDQRYSYPQNDFCAKDAYNRSSLIRCDRDGFVYKTDEVSILNEVSVYDQRSEYIVL